MELFKGLAAVRELEAVGVQELRLQPPEMAMAAAGEL
jgi:hypothetical protein